MSTYKEIFFIQYANKNGNIKKGTKAIDVWNSIEEFLRLVLTPKPKPKLKTKVKTTNSPLGKIPQSTTATHLSKKKLLTSNITIDKSFIENLNDNTEVKISKPKTKKK